VDTSEHGDAPAIADAADAPGALSLAKPPSSPKAAPAINNHKKTSRVLPIATSANVLHAA
jgi:hypothetical protein